VSAYGEIRNQELSVRSVVRVAGNPGGAFSSGRMLIETEPIAVLGGCVTFEWSWGALVSANEEIRNQKLLVRSVVRVIGNQGGALSSGRRLIDTKSIAVLGGCVTFEWSRGALVSANGEIRNQQWSLSSGLD